MTMNLDRTTLKPMPNYLGGQGTVQYRRALDADVFLTNWAYVDHSSFRPGERLSEALPYRGIEGLFT